jgi:PAS domain S-box-containing protein
MTLLPPDRERERLEALGQYGLGRHSEPAFDDLARLASRLCGVSAAAVSFVDRDQVWLKAAVGLDLRELPRHESFCSVAIESPQPLVVADAGQDLRFCNLPVVVAGPRIRFYAGWPLQSPEGYGLGTLSVMDTCPRELPPEALEALGALSRQTLAQLELRRVHPKREDSPEELARTGPAESGREAPRRSLLEEELGAVVLLDRELRIRQVNASGLGVFQARRSDQILGRPFFHFVASESRKPFFDLAARVLGGDSGTLGLELVGGAGHRSRVELSLAPSGPEAMAASRVVAVLRGVPEERPPEAPPSGLQGRDLDLVRSAPVAFWETDTRGNLTYCNSAWLKLAGRPLEEELGSGWIERVHSEDRERSALALESSLRERRPLVRELRIRVPSGEVRWVLDRGQPQYSDQGDFLGFGGSRLDITDRKRLEERLRQGQKMEVLGHLASSVAHDFSNILTVVLGYATVLKENLAPASALLGPVGDILHAGERGRALCSRLLDFTRKKEPAPEILDLGGTAVCIARLLRPLLGERISLSTRISASLRKVRADSTQMEQALINLAINARDAMPEGGRLAIEMSDVELGDQDALNLQGAHPGPYVMIAVSDTGSGMTAQTQARLFEPFYTTKDAGKGTGLGLWTVHRAVVESGGSIAVMSQPGMGTTFRIYLPAVRP